MPLSEHEQRILAEIERRLLEEDPKFAQQVGSSFQAHLARRLKLAGLSASSRTSVWASRASS